MTFTCKTENPGRAPRRLRLAARVRPLVAAALTACSADASGPARPGPLAGVVVSPGSSSVYGLQPVQFTAAAVDGRRVRISGLEFDWSTAQGGVVSVGPTGLVTGVGDGSASVYATVRGTTVRGEAQVRVTMLCGELQVTPAAVTLRVQQSARLSVVTLDDSSRVLAGRRVLFDPVDPSIVGVSPDGTVTGRSPGTGQVRVRCDDARGEETRVTVTVAP